MRVGNLPQTVWKRSILKQLNKNRAGGQGKFLLRPSIEECCTVMRVSETDAVITAAASVSGDSVCTGTYGIIRAVNDLRLRGAEAAGVSISLTLPETVEEVQIKEMISCMEEISEELQAAIMQINAEVNPAVCRAMVHATAYGVIHANKDGFSIPGAGGAAAGQDLVLCGYTGLEGTLRILDEREEELGQRFVPAFLRQMKEKNKFLVFPDIGDMAERYNITAVHQVQSGGIFAALWELAEASGIGMHVDLSKMNICQETVEVCEFYRLNPYLMTSAGCALLASSDGNALVDALEAVGARATRLGVATAGNARVITSGEEERYLDRPAQDELMRWYSEQMRS